MTKKPLVWALLPSGEIQGYKLQRLNWPGPSNVCFNTNMNWEGTHFTNMKSNQDVCLGTSLAVQWLRLHASDFPGGAVVKNPPANAGDMGLSPGPGRSHMLQSN